MYCCVESKSRDGEDGKAGESDDERDLEEAIISECI